MGLTKKNIVIGGTGFIGSALVQELVRCGEKVVSISRHIPEEKISGVEYFALNVESETEKLQAILGNGNTIFLLTGQNYANFDSEKEKKIFEIILDAVRNSAPEKVFFASSALVYGNCEVSTSEEDECDPKDAYSIFKSECELLIEKKLNDTPVGILRLANVYGSEKNKGFVGLVFKKALAEEGMKVNGDGMQERDYIFIDDVVSALIAVRDGLYDSDVINIATGKSLTLLDVIRLAEEASGRQVSYEITGIPVDEVNTSRIDASKLKEKYGFEAKMLLAEGLRKTWDRYQGGNIRLG